MIFNLEKEDVQLIVNALQSEAHRQALMFQNLAQKLADEANEQLKEIPEEVSRKH